MSFKKGQQKMATVLEEKGRMPLPYVLVQKILELEDTEEEMGEE